MSSFIHSFINVLDIYYIEMMAPFHFTYKYCILKYY